MENFKFKFVFFWIQFFFFLSTIVLIVSDKISKLFFNTFRNSVTVQIMKIEWFSFCVHYDDKFLKKKFFLRNPWET